MAWRTVRYLKQHNLATGFNWTVKLYVSLHVELSQHGIYFAKQQADYFVKPSQAGSTQSHIK